MLDRSVPPEGRVAVVAMPGVFQRWAYDNPDLRFRAIQITRPDQLRGINVNRVIWLETPRHWSPADIAEARQSAELCARAGENPRVEGEVPFSRADAIAWLRSEVNTGISETAVGKPEHDRAWSEFYRAMAALGVTRGEVDRAFE